jgi:uncharacterized protein (DUF2225 family)
MTTFHTVPGTCPGCNTQINLRALTSTNTFGPRFTDFRQDAAGFQPRMIVMNLCKDCGFAGYTTEFKVENVLPETVREKIAQRIKPQIDDEAVSMSQVYSFHAQIGDWLGKPPLDIADSYLKAAWCCQDEGDEDGEMEARRLAISYFKDAISDGSLGEDMLPNITYLVGELYRRTGDSVHAFEWFNKVIDTAKTDAKWGSIAELAQQQRDEPRDTL